MASQWSSFVIVFEVVKSNTIILMADSNNHLHTLSKKKCFFEFHHFWRKQRGVGHQVLKKKLRHRRLELIQVTLKSFFFILRQNGHILTNVKKW
jgi:hypothetical protein